MSTSYFSNSFSIQNKIRNRTSVFSNRYISTSKDGWYGDDSFKEKAYLQWNTATFSNLGLSTNILTALDSDAIWELLITDVSEQHSELYAKHETLAGTVCYFASGAASIKLTITAHVHVSGSADYRTVFLYQYIKNLRAKQLAYNDCFLTLVIKDTTEKIYITNLQLVETSTSPDMATLVITCIAFRYRNTFSTEELYKDTYSKNMSVPRVSSTPKKTAGFKSDKPGADEGAEPTPVEK